MKYTISFLLLFVAISLNAQKSDLIKYHLVLDNSGSVNWMDRNDNLKFLLKEMSYVRNWQDSSEFKNAIVSFDLILYGNDVTVQELNLSDITSSSVNDLMNRMNKDTRMEKRRAVGKSDLLAPINDIIERLEKEIEEQRGEEKNQPSQAVIIFTDGILKSGDISVKMSLYDSLLKTSLNVLKEIYKVPVFTVVSNGGTTLDADLSTLEGFYGDSAFADSSITSFSKDNIFWVSNKLNLNKDYSVISESFNQFQLKINTELVSTPFNSKLKGDVIYVAYKIQELHNLISSLSKLDDNKDKVQFSRQNQLNIIKEIMKDEPYCSYYNDLESLMQHVESDTLNYLESAHLMKKLSGVPELFDFLKNGLERKFSNTYIKNIIKKGSTGTIPFEKLKPATVESVKAFNIVQTSLEDNYPMSDPNDFEIVSLEEPQKIKQSLESNIIIGFSDYLVERVKLESVYSLFENLTEEMQELRLDKYFPITWKLLSDNSNYTDFSRINNAFQRDLDALPETLSKMNLKVNSELLVLRYVYGFIDQLILDGQYVKALSALEQFRVFEKNTSFDSLNFNEKRSFLAEEYILFSAKLISFLEKADIDKLLSSQEHSKEFAKLISEYALSETLPETVGILPDIVKNEELLFQLKTLYKKYKSIEGSIKRYKQITSQTSQNNLDQRKYSNEILLNIIDESIDLLVEVNDLGQFFKINEGRKYDINRSLIIMRDIKDFYFHIRKKEYAKAVYTAAP